MSDSGIETDTSKWWWKMRNSPVWNVMAARPDRTSHIRTTPSRPAVPTSRDGTSGSSSNRAWAVTPPVGWVLWMTFASASPVGVTVTKRSELSDDITDTVPPFAIDLRGRCCGVDDGDNGDSGDDDCEDGIVSGQME